MSAKQKSKPAYRVVFSESSHGSSFTDVSSFAFAEATVAGHPKAKIEEIVWLPKPEKLPIPPHHFDSCQGQAVCVRLPRRLKEFRGEKGHPGYCIKCRASLISHRGRWVETYTT